MYLSNLSKIGTLTVLAFSIMACSGGSSDTPTNNPTTIPTKPTTNTTAEDKAKAEAEAKAKAEAEAKAKAEAAAKAAAEAKAKAEAEAKAKAEAEAKAKQPEEHKTHIGMVGGQASYLSGLTRVTTDDNGATIDPLKEVMPLDGSGRKMITRGSYHIYSNSLSNAAISVLIYPNGRDDVAVGYAGRATNANELATLKGTASYTGKGFIADLRPTDVIVSEAVTNITANFDTRKVSGLVSDGNFNVDLKEAHIVNDGGVIGFNGVASIANTSQSLNASGVYDGRFMGQGAKEVAGKALFTPASVNTNYGGIGVSFSGSKVE